MPLFGHVKSGLLALCVVLLTMPAFAADEEDFIIDTTGDLAALCGAQPGTANYVAAIHMCQGYMIGVHHFHEALAAEIDEDVYCEPEPNSADAPARDQVTAMFVDWVAANPSVASTEALDGFLRWANATFPCT